MTADLRGRLLEALCWAYDMAETTRLSEWSASLRKTIADLEADERRSLVPVKASGCPPECRGHTEGKFCDPGAV